MKTFKEWLEAYHLGRPHGQMGPDGKIYGWSGGPASRLSPTNTWQSGGRDALPMSDHEKQFHLSKAWKNSTPEFKRNALQGLVSSEDSIPENWADLSREQQMVVGRLLGI